MGNSIEKIGWHEFIRYKTVTYLMKHEYASQNDLYDYLRDEKIIVRDEDLYEFYDMVDELYINGVIEYFPVDVAYSVSFDSVWRYFFKFRGLRCS